MAGLELNVSTVFLDAGGVLVEPDWGRVSATLARHGIDAATEALANAEPAVRRAQDSPAGALLNDENRLRAFFRAVAVAAGAASNAALEAGISGLEQQHARNNLWGRVVADARDSLERLRATGRRLAVVSNANGTVRAHFERLGLAGYFDVIVDSGEVGVEKPDPRIFQLALAQLHVPPHETIHVGDLFHIDVVGARAAGLTPILLDPLGLYPDADCWRVSSLTALADYLAAPQSPAARLN